MGPLHLLTLLVSVSTAFATPRPRPMPPPWTLKSVRPLTERDIDPRTNCPGYLPGASDFEFPHYITQIRRSEPDTAVGPQYFGVFTPNDTATVFSFDVPLSRASSACTLEFLFPRADQLSTSAFSYAGGGTFQFTGYNPGSCPGDGTTWNHQPASDMFLPFPPIHMEPGNVYVIDVGPCWFAAGTCIAGVTTSPDTNFTFFQDQGNGDGDCPIGVFALYS
jgi:hypothetical protein